MGLQTLLGLKHQRFFILYRYADQLSEPGTLDTYPPLLTMFDARKNAQLEFIQTINKYTQTFENIGENLPHGPR